MTTKLVAPVLCICVGLPAFAHRLDEYLQAAMISVEKDHMHASMRLVPGVAVSAAVLASIDSNGDGVISQIEGHAYAERVLHDLSLSIDGRHLNPRLVSVSYPKVEDMREGLGEIQIDFNAELPRGPNRRKLVFENHHQSRMAAYLVNCLVPGDRGVRILAQNRNRNQSFYELDYLQAGSQPDALSATSGSIIRPLIDNVGGLGSTFRLGMRHIAEGTDHLLFLLALLLPAPLLTFRSRWATFASLRQSVTRILKIVTAFTVGHSITLALAGLGFVVVPSRPIEILIAVSILVSAIHAFRPFFLGREVAIAAFFGLIHGLAFAATLDQLGLSFWTRIANLFAFNIGIEAMQLMVVLATMPSLVLLSRTRAYSFFRVGGSLFAGLASAGWVVERLLDLPSSVNALVGPIAHRAPWIAALLFVVSVVCWWICRLAGKQAIQPLSGRPLEQSA